MGAEQSNNSRRSSDIPRTPQMSEAQVKRLLETQRQQYEKKCQELMDKAAAAAQQSPSPTIERERTPYQYTRDDLQNVQMQSNAARPLYPNLNQAASTSSNIHSFSFQNNNSPQYPRPPQDYVFVNNYGQTGCRPAPSAPSAPPAPAFRGRDRSVSRNRNNNSRNTGGNEMNCPTCMSRFGLNIFQCDNGHSSCSDCKTMRRSCGRCGQALTNRRNYDVENIVAQTKVPCPHSDDGCQLYIKMADIETHIKECPFKEQLCPIGPIFGCYWKGKLNQMSDHFKNSHPSRHQTDVDSEMRLHNIQNTSKEVHLVVLGVYNFLLHIKVSEVNENISMTVQLIGTQMSASKWQYEIHVYNKSESRRKYTFIDNCSSSNEPVNDIFKEGKCAVLPYAYAKTFINDRDSALTFKFFIKKSNEERREFGKNNRGRGRDYSAEQQRKIDDRRKLKEDIICEQNVATRVWVNKSYK